MGASASSGPEAQYAAILTAFILRARRVCAHSLLQDLTAAEQFANHTVTMTVTPGSPTVEMSWRYPNEELFESLAARVRPLVLQEESTFCMKAMGALGYFARGTVHGPRVAQLRTAWGSVVESTATSPMKVSVSGKDGVLGEYVPSSQLAYAYIYGDLVHASEARKTAIPGHDLMGRFEAAVPLVFQIALRTLATLNLTIQMKNESLISLDDALFDEQVHIDVTERTEQTSARFYPVGTDLQDADYDATPYESAADIARGWSARPED